MRAFRSPSHVPGLAVAGAAFAVVAIIFGTAGGLVSFHFRPSGPPPPAQHALVLPAPRAAPAAPAARVAASAPARPSRPVPPPTAAPTGESSPQSSSPAAASLPATVVPAPGVARRAPQLPAPPPPPAPRPPVRAPQRSSVLRPVGDLVGETTTGVARALRTTTQAVAQGTEFISPVLATVIAQAGEVLGDTVAGVGRALGLLLGSPPDADPGAGAPTPP